MRLWRKCAQRKLPRNIRSCRRKTGTTRLRCRNSCRNAKRQCSCHLDRRLQCIGFRYTAVLAITPALAIALTDTVGRPFGNPFRECVGDIHGIVRPIGQLNICKRRELRIDLLIGAAQFLDLGGHCIAGKDDCRIASPLHGAGKSLKTLDKVCILTQFRVLSVGDTRNRRDVLLWQIFKQTSSPFIH